MTDRSLEAATATSLMAQETAQAGAVVDRMLTANHASVHDLAQKLRSLDPPFVVTLARGSSDHAAAFAKVLIETRLRLPVVSQAPSIGSLYRCTSPKLAGVPVFAISQSGSSPDILAAAEDAKRVGALVVAIVNVEDSPLATLADYVLPLHAGPEKSVAATKSFIASLAALAQLTAEWGSDDGLRNALGQAGSILDEAVQKDWSAALPLLLDARSLLVLGRGLTLPIAGEAALKLKETARLHAESFSIAEVAHGPMTLIAEHDPVFVFAPADAARTGTDSRIQAFASRGAQVIATGPAEDIASATVRLSAAKCDDPVASAMGQIASFYRLAERLAQARGLDPDAPAYLAKVTKTL